MMPASRFPAASLLLLFSTATLSWVWVADAYPSGAPSSVCDTMTPHHSSIVAQATPSPYLITPGGASVNGGQKISVTVAGVDPATLFKGFFLQARDTNTSLPLGTFVTSTQKLVSCGSGFSNAVTHPSSTPVSSVTVEWAAPANYRGDVAFRATVVRQFDTFWAGITSEKVTVILSAPSSLPTTTTTTQSSNALTTPGEAAPSPAADAPPVAATGAADGATPRRGLLGNFKPRTTPPTPPELAKAPTTEAPGRGRLSGSGGSLANAIDNIYLGCSVNKGCYGLPEGCTNNCNSLFTYTKKGSSYQFEIMGHASGNAYVAGGLSFDEEMGDDSVMACRSYNGVADITMAWNKGKSNQFLVDQKQGLSNYEMTLINGTLYCRFTRVAYMTINNNIFDLDNGTFHVLVAKGPLNADGSVSYHSDRAASTATSLSQFEALGSSDDLFFILHASFMVIAWVGSASTGILIARYFKQTWKNYKTCGIDQWFHCHRFFMITTWCLTMAGFILMAIKIKGFTDSPPNKYPHAYIGIVSVALCFIQPFMAMLRCKPTDSRRPIFNWAHWFVGNSAQVLGITAIFFGLEMKGLPRWTWWLMIIFVGFHCLVHVLLSIGDCVSDSKAKKRVSGIAMKDFSSSRDMLQPPQDGQQDAPGGTFRKAMLALYLVVIWLVVALLLLVIIAGKEQLREWNIFAS